MSNIDWENIDWSNRAQVLEAVSQNGYALVCASETLQNDREVVLAAVSQNGEALRCASETLQSDPVLKWFVNNRVTLLNSSNVTYDSLKEIYDNKGLTATCRETARTIGQGVDGTNMNTFNQQGAIIALARCGLSQSSDQGGGNTTPILNNSNASAKGCCVIS